MQDVHDGDGVWVMVGAVEQGGSMVHAGCVEWRGKGKQRIGVKDFNTFAF